MNDIVETYVRAAKTIIAAHAPVESVWLQAPDLIKQWAQNFIDDFPGGIDHLAYAVKANPDPKIINTIHKMGIKNFEVASLEEAAFVRAALHPQNNYAFWFHNPLCSTKQIDVAFSEFSTRNFVVTNMGSFDQLRSLFSQHNIRSEQIHIAVRIKVRSGNHAADGAYDHLFACDYSLETHAVPLLLEVAQAGYRHSLYFNVSTQTINPQLYAEALSDVSKTINLAKEKGLTPNFEYINIGAGFPSPEGDLNWKGYAPFFDAIREVKLYNSDGSVIPYAAEPGRALVAPCEALLVPINQVDEANNRLILSQSLAGGLHHLAKLPEVAPIIQAINGDGEPNNESPRAWHITGGSPAGFEVAYPRSIDLPASLKAGDYLLILMQGAYGRSLVSAFNGMSPPYIADIRVIPNRETSVSSIRRFDHAPWSLNHETQTPDRESSTERSHFLTRPLPVRPRMVIFDLSGTLIDSLTHGDRNVLDSICVEFAQESYASLRRKKDDTRSMRYNFRNFFGKQADEVYEEYIQRLTRAIPASQLLPSAADALGFLRRNAIKTAVVTNRPAKYAQAALAYYKLDGLVDILVPGDNSEGVEKPSGAIIKLAINNASLTNISSESVMMVGDTIVDVMCADAAGVIPVLFSEKDFLSADIQKRFASAQRPPLVWVPNHKALIEKITATL